MKSIMGLTPPRKGTVEFKGKASPASSPTAWRRGMGFVPDDRRVFADLTVGENLEIRPQLQTRGGVDTERVYDFFPALLPSVRGGPVFLAAGSSRC